MKKIPLIITLRLSEDEASTVLDVLKNTVHLSHEGVRGSKADQANHENFCSLLEQVIERIEKDLF